MSFTRNRLRVRAASSRLLLLSVIVAALVGQSSPAAAAAIARRASSSVGLNGSALTLTISVPTGTVANDVMVAGVAVRPSTAVITVPAGWTLVRRQDNANPIAHSLAIYYRVAGASEPASYQWTFTTSTGSAGGISSFSGVDTGNPIHVEAPNDTGATLTLSFDAPSVTTTVANTMIVTHYAFTSSATFTDALPLGTAEAFDVASLAVPQSAGISVAQKYILKTDTGATGPLTAVAGNDPDVGTMDTLALMPLAEPAGAQVAEVATGTYVGNATAGKAITGLGFRPDVVLIKGDTTQSALMATSTMPANSTKPLVGASAPVAGEIQSLDADGFTLGAGARANGSGVNYYWVAFKAIAGEVKVGTYVGTGAGQPITGVGFQPGLVVTLPRSTHNPNMKTQAMGTRSFNFFVDTGGITRITSLDADGFTVGTVAQVSNLGTTFDYVAWNQVAGKMTAGTYTGNGTTQNVTGLGLPAHTVIIKNGNTTTGQRALQHPRSLGESTDSTLNFTAAANFAGGITALLCDGFSVGADLTANQSGTTHYYVAFGGPISYVGATATPGAPGTVTLRWYPTSSPVLILRKPGAFDEAADKPTQGASYAAGNTIGGATVRLSGTGTGFTDSSGLSNGTIYNYRIFQRTSSNCYSPGATTDVTGRPVASGGNEQWAYMSNNGAALRAPTTDDSGNVYVASNASRVISLSGSTGLQNWAPSTTTSLVQGYLVWTSLSSGGWLYRKQITIDRTKVGGTLTEFPVLVGLTDGHLQSNAQASGGDIYFTASDGTARLSHEIENYDGATGTLAAWVKVPTLSSTVDTVLYMYYGNAAASDQQDKAGVWTNGYVGVWHLNETVTDEQTTGIHVDSASNDGSQNGSQMGNASTPGRIAGAQDFDGIDDVIEIADTAVLEPANDMTVSAWVKFDVLPGTRGEPAQFVYKRHDPGAPWESYNLEVSTANRPAVNWLDSGTQTNFQAGHNNANAISATGTWYHVVGVREGATLRFYLDGSDANTFTDTTTGTMFNSAGPLVLGASWTGGDRLDGAVDEVRLSNVVRSGAWIATEYNNQRWPNKAQDGATGFLTVAAVAEPLAWGASMVFAGDQSGGVYAMNAASGTTASPGWKKTPTGSTSIQAGVSVQIRAYSDAVNFPAAYPGSYDVVFAATNDASQTNNKLFALRSDTGATLWTFPLAAQNVDQILGQPWIDYARNLLYVTSRAGAGGQSSLWVLDSLTGTVVTSFALGHISTAPTQSYDGNTVWVGNENGDLYALNLAAWPAAPTLKWTGPLALGSAKQVKGYVWEDYSTPGRTYFSTADGTVRCFQDPGVGGTPSAAAICSGWSAVATAVAGPTTVLLLDKIYVGSWDGIAGRIAQINPATGAAGTAYTVGDGTKVVGNMSTVTGAEVLIGTSEGKVFKISLPLP